MTLELKVAIGSKYEAICAELIEGISKKEYATRIIGARGHACYFCGNKVKEMTVLVEKKVVDEQGNTIGKETFILDTNCYFSSQEGKNKLAYRSGGLAN